jgi:hypothetical protein
MALRAVYKMNACESCGEIDQYAKVCDNPQCANYCGPLIEITLKPVSPQPKETTP